MTKNSEETTEDMTLVSHFAELRKRLIWCSVFFIIAFGVSYSFSELVIDILSKPLADQYQNGEHKRLIFTSLTEPFLTYLKLSLYAGFFLTFPFILLQIWFFIAPGLFVEERQKIKPLLYMIPLLFYIGGAFAYFYIFPFAWEFFVSFETEAGALPIELEAKISDYFSLAISFIFAFGLSFELPVVMVILGRFGLVTKELLRNNRKYALIVSFVMAAVLTPPDVFSQIGLALCLLILYEISIHFLPEPSEEEKE